MPIGYSEDEEFDKLPPPVRTLDVNPDDACEFCPDCWERVEDGIAILTYAEKVEAYAELRASCPDGA